MLHQQQQQHEPLTEFISCPVCCKVFNDSQQRPMSLSCGHTVCKSCVHGRMGNDRCPFDQVPFPKDAEKLPSNYALMQLVEATSMKERSVDETLQGSEFDPKCYEAACQYIQEISVYLKPLAENSSDDEGSSSSPATEKSPSKCFLSRPLQRKVISLIQCQLIEEEGRARAARIARSVGERILCEVLTAWQYPHQLSANLWAAVRARGCQFLGPAMQEEVLKLILLTLENGCMLSRKVLVLYVVGKLSSTYPHVSKTAIGHVVQLLYRASCFKVAKREEESSLMQLKEEFREYESLRREHDAQIVQIAMEAGLRIPPEQWSSLLYGDMAHKSHMQSIMDKLQNPQSFSQCVLELVQVLQRNGDPGGFLKLRHRFEFLSCIDPNPDAQVPSLHDIKTIMQSLSMVMTAFVSFMSQPGVMGGRRGGGGGGAHAAADGQAMPNAQYKTSMCWDVATKGYCPRGNTCTFAHTQQELERYRQRSRRNMYKGGPNNKGDSNVAGKQQNGSDVEALLANLSVDGHHSTADDDDFGTTHATIVGTSGSDTMPTPKDPKGPHTHSVTGTTDLGPLEQNSGIGKGFVNASPPPMPPPGHSSVNGTRLTFSQPGKDGPGINFMPQSGFQTSFHPHNMRGPPPPLHRPHHPHLHQSVMSPEGGYSPARVAQQHNTSTMVKFSHNAAPSGSQQQQQQHMGSLGSQLHGQQLPSLNTAGQRALPPFHQQPHNSSMHSHPLNNIVGYPTTGQSSSSSSPSSSVMTSSSQLSQAPVATVSVSSVSHNPTLTSYTKSLPGVELASAAAELQQQNQYFQNRMTTEHGNGGVVLNATTSHDGDQTSMMMMSSSLSDLDNKGIVSVPPPPPPPPSSSAAPPFASRISGDAYSDLRQQHNQHQHQQSQAAVMRMATHSFGGPDGALHSLTNTTSAMPLLPPPPPLPLPLHHHHQQQQHQQHHHPLHYQLPHATPQENTLEDLRMIKKEIIHHMQEEPTFMSSRPQMYCADSGEGGFDGLKTVLGNNQRKREAMPKLVSDMFVATRSTTSLDMLAYPLDCLLSEESNQQHVPPFPMTEASHQPAHSDHPPSVSVVTTSQSCFSSSSAMAVSSSSNALYNSLGTTFEIASSLAKMTNVPPTYLDAEFSSFPMDDDDDEENLIPLEHTVVSKFGPISRMARAKTNNCAPVQVTADSNKKVTPVLAVTPMERPKPNALPVASRFPPLREPLPEPSVKPTPTVAPSVWQNSPQPSQMNIALLRTGAAEAVSNNERLAYELQAIELEISLKTGRTPEPVRQMIHEAVSNPTTLAMNNSMSPLLASATSSSSSSSHHMSTMTTSFSSSSSSAVSPSSSFYTSPGRTQSGVGMSQGHVTEFLTSIASGSSPVSAELAARDIMEEYQRSWKGLTKPHH